MNENKVETGLESREDLVESGKDSWEIAEVVDNAIASGQDSPFMRNEYLYEYKQGGRTIRGLSASMYAHLALVENITEITEESNCIETDDKFEWQVVVERTCQNTGFKQKAQGFAEEPKMMFIKTGDQYDKFAKQKAYTKAHRNACKKLLPFDLVLSAIDQLANRKPVSNVPDQSPQRPQRPQTPVKPPQPAPEGKTTQNGNGNAQNGKSANGGNGKSELEILKGRCFALWNTHNPEKGDGKLSADFWESVKARYGVKSRETMTVKNWRDCVAMISETLNEASQPAKPEIKESDIPF